MHSLLSQVEVVANGYDGPTDLDRRHGVTAVLLYRNGRVRVGSKYIAVRTPMQFHCIMKTPNGWVMSPGTNEKALRLVYQMHMHGRKVRVWPRDFELFKAQYSKAVLHHYKRNRQRHIGRDDRLTLL